MALGKGLGALLGDAAFMQEESSGVMLPISQVEAAANQPRKSFDSDGLQELSQSIALHGVLQPITVRRLSSGYYQIIAGERRWRAARMAGLDEIPAMIIEADDRRAMELALIENLQREDLNAIEEAQGFQSLIDEHGLTQEEVAQRVGRSRSAVANSLRLLGLPENLQKLVEENRITAGHARAILKLKSEKQQNLAAELIIARDLSVRQAETLAGKMEKEHAAEDKPQQHQEIVVNYLEDVEKNLSSVLGRKVSIVSGKKKGRLEIEFYDGNDLEALIAAISALKL